MDPSRHLVVLSHEREHTVLASEVGFECMSSTVDGLELITNLLLAPREGERVANARAILLVQRVGSAPQIGWRGVEDLAGLIRRRGPHGGHLHPRPRLH